MTEDRLEAIATNFAANFGDRLSYGGQADAYDAVLDALRAAISEATAAKDAEIQLWKVSCAAALARAEKAETSLRLMEECLKAVYADRDAYRVALEGMLAVIKELPEMSKHMQLLQLRQTEAWPCVIAARTLLTTDKPATKEPCCSTCAPNYPGMMLCSTCGNKRCPKAANHENACTGSNEPGQPGSNYQKWVTAETQAMKGEL